MWTFSLGPFFSLFPERWRQALPFSARVHWARATTISGLLEFVLALIALGYWYFYGMTTWVGHALDQALNGKLGPGATDQQIGSVALFVWATHPRTWLLGYFLLEGAVRLCGAAFSGNVLGTFPFFLLDKIFFSAFRRRETRPGNAASPSNLSSYLGAVRDRMMVAKLPMVSDELCFSKNASEEILEIRACRKKEDWTPPRVVRYQDSYYRLEECSRGAGPRPFRYLLRRLSAGVPGRTVILYSPPGALLSEKR